MVNVQRRSAAAMVGLFVALLNPPLTGRAAVPNPVVTGPIGTAGIRGHALFDSWFRLGDIGYTEDEYFVSGTARSYEPAGGTASYTTRIIVTRPGEQSGFNGTVMLDWTNVTAQFENAVDSIAAHEFLFRAGYAFVHVSAQAAGICCTPLTPKIWDPVRYRALSHPGDAYSFDIFSQVAQAIRSPEGIDPMGGLPVQRVIAAGQSQSASRLASYVRRVQPEAGVIDGFLIHGGGSRRFEAPPVVPVLHLMSDAEASSDETTTDVNYRLWEIAGAAHSDFWTGYHQVVGQGPRTLLDAPQRPASADEAMHRIAGNYGEIVHPLDLVCTVAGATFPMRYAVSAAIHHLDTWIRGGPAPASGPRFQLDAAGALARDRFGNALGGIRLPPVEVPVATYRSTDCVLGGITIPFSDLTLRRLYPNHATYLRLMSEAAEASVSVGYLLPEDAQDLLARACAAKARLGLRPPDGC